MSALDELKAIESEIEERRKRINRLLNLMITEEAERIGQLLIDKMKSGGMENDDIAAECDGYSNAYAAMCHLCYYKKDYSHKTYYFTVREAFDNYSIPHEIESLVQLAGINNDMTWEEAAHEAWDIKEKIIKVAFDYVMDIFSRDIKTAEREEANLNKTEEDYEREYREEFRKKHQKIKRLWKNAIDNGVQVYLHDGTDAKMWTIMMAVIGVNDEFKPWLAALWKMIVSFKDIKSLKPELLTEAVDASLIWKDAVPGITADNLKDRIRLNAGEDVLEKYAEYIDAAFTGLEEKEYPTETTQLVERTFQNAIEIMESQNSASPVQDTDVDSDETEDEDDGEYDDLDDTEDTEDDETECLKENLYFCHLRECMRAAFDKYRLKLNNPKFDRYVDELLKNLDLFASGDEIEEQFGFYINKYYKEDGYKNFISLCFSLRYDEINVNKGGYVNGPYGGDSYTDWSVWLWQNGSTDMSDLPPQIFEVFDDMLNEGHPELHIDEPDEYYGEPDDGEYWNDETDEEDDESEEEND